jgi:hypothetical protein
MGVGAGRGGGPRSASPKPRAPASPPGRVRAGRLGSDATLMHDGLHCSASPRRPSGVCRAGSPLSYVKIRDAAIGSVLDLTLGRRGVAAASGAPPRPKGEASSPSRQVRWLHAGGPGFFPPMLCNAGSRVALGGQTGRHRRRCESATGQAVNRWSATAQAARGRPPPSIVRTCPRLLALSSGVRGRQGRDEDRPCSRRRQPRSKPLADAGATAAGALARVCSFMCILDGFQNAAPS